MRKTSFRKKNIRKTRKNKKGGTTMSFGDVKMEQNGILNSYNYNNTEMPGSVLKRISDSDLKKKSIPTINYTLLDARFSPNTNPNFVFYRTLIAEVTLRGNKDLETLNMFINYIHNQVINELNNDPKNTNKIKYSEKNVKINDLKLENKTETVEITASIYVDNMDKLTLKVNKQLNKLPDEMVNEIKSY